MINPLIWFIIGQEKLVNMPHFNTSSDLLFKFQHTSLRDTDDTIRHKIALMITTSRVYTVLYPEFFWVYHYIHYMYLPCILVELKGPYRCLEFRSHSKMNWWAIYTDLSANLIVRLPHPRIPYISIQYLIPHI